MDKKQAYAMLKSVIDGMKLTTQERHTLMTALNTLIEPSVKEAIEKL